MQRSRPSVRQGRRGPLGLLELIAIGVGGMIGGGIFSMLGLAVSITGHAAPLAFLIGALVAFFAGYSYIRLALTFRSDGASYIYLARAFPRRPEISTLVGWTVIIGYVGTLALYAFTFGAYGAEMLNRSHDPLMRMALSLAVLLFFLFVNLRGARTTGHTEDLVVYAKILILGVFAVAGLHGIDPANMAPLLNRGVASVFMAGALIFVAFEGFQLITNAVTETEDPDRNVPRGIYGAIFITSAIYILLAVVAIGNLPERRIIAAEEYALAEAARPVLGEAGVLLVGIAALLATSSAINATVFGAARMMAEMAGEGRMPAFLARRNLDNVPWIATVVLIALGGVFTLAGGLGVIAAFSSMTFLLVSIGVSVANWRLRLRTGAAPWAVLAGIALMATTVVLLVIHLLRDEPRTLAAVAGIYLAAGIPAWFYGRALAPAAGSADGEDPAAGAPEG
ncbi:MAG TPA: amino acid permease [Thermopetrobacter sp.]|nr:amino acid permease [Thermopetrobacter sp.]